MTGPDDAERWARLALSRLVEPGSWPVHDAVAEHGPIEVVAALRRGVAVGRLSPALVEAARLRAQSSSADDDARRLAGCGARLTCPGDDEWPQERLAWRRSGSQLAAPPLALFVRGAAPLAEVVERSVAVVGARAASPYGEHVAADLALGLADRGVSVVSGGAYGIDGAAHRAALSSSGDGRTVAVLACGVDVPYPRGHDRLLSRVAGAGLVVSEHPPGATPTRARFLVRNRLIAALACGTVVVEAALRSGSLSTAGRALDLLRPVMAVPGPVTSALSAGCHALLRSDAGEPAVLVTSPAEVLAVVGRLGEDDVVPGRGPQRLHDDLPLLVRSVLEAVPVSGGAGEAALARAAGLPVLAVQQTLPALLVAGLVRQCDSGWVLTPLGAGRS